MKEDKKYNENYKNEILIAEVADLFKIFGDSSRIKILYTMQNGKICVSDIADSVNMTQSAVSHQLRLLKQSNLVKSQKEGKIVYYSLDDAHVKSILDVGMEHIIERGVK